MTETLHLTLLGGLAVTQGQAELRGFVSRKARALLAYLAVTGRSHFRDALAGLLWGQAPEERAAGNLRVVLSNLRRLAPDHVIITRQMVAFDRESDYWLDVGAFQECVDRSLSASPSPSCVRNLCEAVELYQGDFLEGFYVRGAPAFEEWVTVERERLRQMVLQALHCLVRYHTARGEYATGIEYATRLLALDSWREEAHRELMRLLALSGQRSAALAQYEECRRLLAGELGMEPLEETTALYERLVEWQTGELGMGRSIDGELGTPGYRVTDLPFVGRGEEHATLVSWWQAAQQSQEGRLALVEGEAGVGKTRLVEEVIRYAEAQGAVVLHGRCYEFGGSVPYQPLAEALRGRTAQLTHLDDVWLAELARLLPEVHHVHPDLPEPVKDSGEAARQRLFEAISRFLLVFGSKQGPLLLFFDDLHWADQSTLDLLHYLVRRLSDAPIGIVGAYRPEELSLSHPVTRLRQGLSRDHLVNHLSLEPLSPKAVEQAAHSLVGEKEGAALGAFLYHESEGNPFILVETVNDLWDRGALHDEERGRWQWAGPPTAETLPISVQDVILQRVGRLDESAQRLLMLAVTIGRQFDIPLLQAAAGLDVDAVDASLKAWLARRLVQEYLSSGSRRPTSDTQYDFSHDKIRAVVYHYLAPERRQLLHGRVGQALLDCVGYATSSETSPVEVPDSVAAQVAHHLECSSTPRQAAPYLAQAAKAAHDVYAYEVALGYYQRLQPLLPEAEQVAVMIDMATLWMLVRQNPQAETLLQQAAEMGQRTGGYKQRAKALYVLADVKVNQGDYRAALESANQAETAARLAGKEAWPELVMALKWKGWAYYRVGDIATASVLARETLALSKKIDDQTWEMESLNLLSATLNWVGDYEQGAQCLERALALSRALGDPSKEPLMLNNLGYTIYQRGDYETAIALYQQALHIGQEIAYQYVEILSLNNLGGAWAAVGEYSVAEEHLQQVLDMVGSRRWFLLTETYRYLAEAHLGQGRVDEALTAAQQALALAREAEARQYAGMAWRVLGKIAAQSSSPIHINDETHDAAACFAKSLQIFTELGMEGERARTMALGGAMLAMRMP